MSPTTRENAKQTSSLAVIALVGALGSVAGALLSSTEIAGRLMRPQIVIVADERMGAILRQEGPKLFATRTEWEAHIEYARGRVAGTDSRFAELRADLGQTNSKIDRNTEAIRTLAAAIRAGDRQQIIRKLTDEELDRLDRQ